MASKIDRLMALCDAEVAWNNRDLNCGCDHNEFCDKCFPPEFRKGGRFYDIGKREQLKPEALRAMLTLMQEMRTALGAVRPNHGTTYAACVSFDRWNEESEDGV